MARRSTNFSLAVKTEGGLFPTDFLLDLAALSNEIEGLKPEQYHLSDREKINEAINQAYSRLQGFWLSFKDAFEKLPLDDYATSATREKWLLPLFDCLGYGRLTAAEAVTVGDRQYKPSHMRESVAIHLVGFRVDLDKRSTAGGARSSSPHSLVQELLNQSDNHLWAFVSNGRKLRVLRDNVSLTRQAFIEFDIENIFEGDGYADFRLLWLLCHQSRVEGVPTESCWLEKWKDEAQRSGIRVREQLRVGVEKALESFGTGFLRHQANEVLRARIRNGEISAEEYYRQLLRLIYRLLFLFVTEDKNVLQRPDATAQQRKMYYSYYSTTRLREIAGKRKGTMHEDLWANLSFVFDQLSKDSGCAELGLPGLGSFLWSSEATPIFNANRLYNKNLLEGFLNLCFTIESGVRRPVQYGHLESEELGSIYESLLDQVPYIDTRDDLPSFFLRQTAGSERKTTGSYYTPSGLVNCLLDSALEPVLNRAVREKKPEEAILNLKICDPACGSGHFLIAAAHRMAKRLASVRSGDMEPGPEFTNIAIRDVISRCIYGVDANEMAVELCKVSLWLQSAVPGVPLSFLDHKIKCGNSLLGATPALIENGLPDAAFDSIEGDDKELVKRIKAANKQQTDAHTIPGFLKYNDSGLAELSYRLSTIDQLPDNSVAEIHTKELNYANLLSSDSFLHAQYICDSWCAAFVWNLRPGAPPPITREVFGRIRSDYRNIAPEVTKEILRLRKQFKFFHWHLEFPHVFQITNMSTADAIESQCGWNGGFDLLLGNPPWDRVKLQDTEWFASKSPEITNARTASIREKKIKSLEKENPSLWLAFRDAQRAADSRSHIIRKSGAYPLCGRGDVNTYSVFAELMLRLINQSGSVGCVVPSGIATDNTTKFFFQKIMDTNKLSSFISFYEIRKFFPGTDSRVSFCLMTLSNLANSELGADFVFDVRDLAELADENRHVRLNTMDIRLLNPNSRTCPSFLEQRDFHLAKSLYSKFPVLILETEPVENPWALKLFNMFHMSNDAALLRTREELEAAGWSLARTDFKKGEDSYLPLYEAKMVGTFDHRWASFEADQYRLVDEQLKITDDSLVSLPEFWVPKSEVDRRCHGWDRNWMVGWRDIINTDRTVIGTILPKAGMTGLNLFYSTTHWQQIGCLLATMTSFLFDYIARQKLSGKHLNFMPMKQLPVIPPERFGGMAPWSLQTSLTDFVQDRVVELVYTNSEMRYFAKDISQRDTPYKWNSSRRELLRCELDATIFYLYGLSLSEVSEVMDSFRVVRERDIKTSGHFRTHALIIECLERMHFAATNRKEYESPSQLGDRLVARM